MFPASLFPLHWRLHRDLTLLLQRHVGCIFLSHQIFPINFLHPANSGFAAMSVALSQQLESYIKGIMNCGLLSQYQSAFSRLLPAASSVVEIMHSIEGTPYGRPALCSSCRITVVRKNLSGACAISSTILLSSLKPDSLSFGLSGLTCLPTS